MADETDQSPESPAEETLDNESSNDGEDPLKGEDVTSGTGLQPKAPEGSDETGPSENPKASEPQL